MITTVAQGKPEDIILCDEQEERFCGQHALRALTQRCDLFSDEYLKGIAKNLHRAVKKFLQLAIIYE